MYVFVCVCLSGETGEGVGGTAFLKKSIGGTRLVKEVAYFLQRPI